LALLVDQKDDGMGGRIDVEADDVFELFGELRVVRQFERSDAVRHELVGLEDALSECKLTPAAFASVRPVQWFASPGAGPSARSTTRCTVPGGNGSLPGMRVLSRVSPATPSGIKRACHVHTTGFDLSERRMISAVPQPAAVARIILARHTCVCCALRSETIASSRRPSSRAAFTTIPALMTKA
jgi:hypothetical protein